MIAKFEFKVTVYTITYGQNTPSCEPLKQYLHDFWENLDLLKNKHLYN